MHDAPHFTCKTARCALIDSDAKWLRSAQPLRRCSHSHSLLRRADPDAFHYLEAKASNMSSQMITNSRDCMHGAAERPTSSRCRPNLAARSQRHRASPVHLTFRYKFCDNSFCATNADVHYTTTGAQPDRHIHTFGTAACSRLTAHRDASIGITLRAVPRRRRLRFLLPSLGPRRLTTLETRLLPQFHSIRRGAQQS